MYGVPFDIPISELRVDDLFVMANFWWRVVGIKKKPNIYVLSLEARFKGRTDLHIPDDVKVRIKRWVGY